MRSLYQQAQLVVFTDNVWYFLARICSNIKNYLNCFIFRSSRQIEYSTTNVYTYPYTNLREYCITTLDEEFILRCLITCSPPYNGQSGRCGEVRLYLLVAFNLPQNSNFAISTSQRKQAKTTKFISLEPIK